MHIVRTSFPRPLRALIAAILAVGLSLIVSPFARADGTIKAYANSANWFWDSNTKVTTQCEPPDGPIPNANKIPACGPVSGTGGTYGIVPKKSPISDGHLGVAMKDGDMDMRAYLGFDLSSIPVGADISSFVVTLSVSTLDQQHSSEHQASGKNPPATINQDQAFIQACAATEPFADANGAGGDPPYSKTFPPASSFDPEHPNDNVTTQINEPTYDCSLNVQGKQAADARTFSFDITPIAQKWADGTVFNNGIVLVPIQRGASPTWTVEFHGRYLQRSDADGNKTTIIGKREAAFAQISYSGGTTTFPPPPPTVPPGNGGGAGVIVPPDTGSNLPEQPTPAVTTPPATVPPVVQVASHPRTPGYVWLLLPLGVLALGLVTSAIGADELAAASASNRVAGVLRSRRLNGAAEVDEP